MRLDLVNPSNPLVSIVNVNESRWNRYRVWQPLSLMGLAGLTPPGGKITIVDENLGAPDYPALPRPDLVGITVFTSQANRAYEVAAHFRAGQALAAQRQELLAATEPTPGKPPTAGPAPSDRPGPCREESLT